MSEHRASFSTFIFLGFSTLVALADQLIKWLVQQSMAYRQSVEITPFFNWVHVWNKGAAFSLFADGGGWQRYFFYCDSHCRLGSSGQIDSGQPSANRSLGLCDGSWRGNWKCHRPSFSRLCCRLPGFSLAILALAGVQSCRRLHSPGRDHDFGH